MAHHRILFFVSTMLLAQLSCSSDGSVDTDPTDDQLLAASDGIVFLTRTPTSSNVLKFRCAASTDPQSNADVLAQCSDEGGAGMQLDAFMNNVRRAYLERVGDRKGELSQQEEMAWRNLRRQIVGETALETGKVGDRAVLGKITSRFFDVLNIAYVGGALRGVTAGTAGVAPGSASSNFAAGDIVPRGPASNEEEIGSDTFRSRTIAGNQLRRLTLRLPTRNYDGVRVEVGGATAGTPCRALQSVDAIATGLTPNPNGAAMSWKLSPASKLSELQLRVRTRATSASETCTAKVYAAVGNTPPVPVPPTEKQAIDLMQALMGTADHRMWHFLWHGIRNSWDRMTPAQQAQIVAAFGADWRRKPNDADTGEEFLHMHRMMLGMLNSAAKSANYTLYPTGVKADNLSVFNDVWTSPGVFSSQGAADKKFPFPDGTTRVDENLRAWDIEAKSAAKLALPLGEYGTWLEQSLHNRMHMMWADTRDGGNGPGRDLFSPSEVERIKNPPASWTAVSNQYLGSTYTSHVNPLFWRLHGYVDNRINDWMRAHNFERIGESTDASCTPAAKCYSWKRVWDGQMPGHHGGMNLGQAFGALDAGTQRAIVDNSLMSSE